jgi:hypothetical protein
MKRYFIRNPDTSKWEELSEAQWQQNNELLQLVGLDKPRILPWTILDNPPVEKKDETTNKSTNID